MGQNIGELRRLLLWALCGFGLGLIGGCTVETQAFASFRPSLPLVPSLKEVLSPDEMPQ